MFASLKNGQLAKRDFILHPRKKLCENYLQVLWREGFILGYTVEYPDINKLRIFLRYRKGRPAITSIQRISKPGRRIYCTIKQIWKIDCTRSTIIFSTNQGLKTTLECKRWGIGGEPVVLVK
jgi:small subunit ribosomal protein S8